MSKSRSNQRFFLRKKENFRQYEAAKLKELQKLFPELALESIKIFTVYDIYQATETEIAAFKDLILHDPVQDEIISGENIGLPLVSGTSRADTPNYEETNMSFFGVETIEGQFNQQAHVAQESLKLLLPESSARVKSAELFVFQAGTKKDHLLPVLKKYLINPVCQEEKDFSVLAYTEEAEPEPLRDYSKFLDLDEAGLISFLSKEGLAMSLEDILLIQEEFKRYGRVPTEVEIKVLDTYWSDHCRHSTFNTEIKKIENQSELFHEEINSSLEKYEKLRHDNGRENRHPSLMEMATIVARDLRRRGLLERQEVSDEINACSVHINVESQGEEKPWLLMFKNETHNHPTEIEPFGGAGTCLGGCIRDPLSGRAKVYQGVRITGAGDISAKISDTREHKLPQYYLSTEAAKGFSDYANQIGVAATSLRELHHPGYVAKRMECGALVAATPLENVTRAEPRVGDVVILLGAPTGRDGIGGATGSSQAQDRDSAKRSGAEVQKGNPPAEQGIMQLFCRPEIAPLIRKCNDFGAGGVSVAVGEIADSLDIDLDKVTTKYPGLNAMELAISESQERMAILVAEEDVETIIAAAAEEDVPANVIAKVTDSGYLRMTYQGETVFEISRKFIETDGASRSSEVIIKDLPSPKQIASAKLVDLSTTELKEHLNKANFGSQKGLAEQFDSTIGRSTVLLPYGGSEQNSEEMISLQSLPVPGGSKTVSAMAFGYSPEIADYSPYLMGAYSLIEAISKLTAAGLDYRTAFLSNQEFFPSLKDEPSRWGVVFQSLLGLVEAGNAFSLASIGGKDSMSGSFEDIDVPPTLITFAVTHGDISQVLSLSLPRKDFRLIYLPHNAFDKGLPNYEQLRNNFLAFQELHKGGKVLAASAIRQGGLWETIAKMCLGNSVGLQLSTEAQELDFLAPNLGGLVFAVSKDANLTALEGLDFIELGESNLQAEAIIFDNDKSLTLSEVKEAISHYNAKVYPLNEGTSVQMPDFAHSFNTLDKVVSEDAINNEISENKQIENAKKVEVLIPRFPGSNGADDLAEAFAATGAKTRILRIRQMHSSLSQADEESFIKALREVDILAISGSYGLADEPHGPAVYISKFLSKENVYNALREFVESDHLILGINNGFQALVKAKILPYGFNDKNERSELSFALNPMTRHISTIVDSRIVNANNPWFRKEQEGKVYKEAISASYGALRLSETEAKNLFANGQIISQYVDKNGLASLAASANPLGASYAIEAICSPCGRILGKMAHSERYAPGLWRNIPGAKDTQIFANAVRYMAERS